MNCDKTQLQLFERGVADLFNVGPEKAGPGLQLKTPCVALDPHSHNSSYYAEACTYVHHVAAAASADRWVKLNVRCDRLHQQEAIDRLVASCLTVFKQALKFEGQTCWGSGKGQHMYCLYDAVIPQFISNDDEGLVPEYAVRRPQAAFGVLGNDHLLRTCVIAHFRVSEIMAPS
ncbi:hypothetical protein E4U14_003720 [Claviceps sp. LM454 group G7]|nr:hypothetical protein E4U14_003720 [Claviceps sp. LM454 group G7]